MEEQITMFGENKIDKALERIKFAYEVATARGLGELYVCFSGGKDSTVLADLCRLAKEKYGIEYSLNYNITGIDPPELVYFMRENYSDLIWHKYEKSIFRLIVEKHMPPTRLVRYCCSELKERGGEGKMCLTGVRREESVKRSSRMPYEVITDKASEKMLFNDNCEEGRDFETCTMKRKLVCNPIIDWTEQEVWGYIKSHKLPYCKLYDEGWDRLGCIGCPMGYVKHREFEFEKYPKFKEAYIKTFDKMLANMPDKKDVRWRNGQEVFDWWVYGSDKPKQLDGQIDFLDIQGEAK